MPPTTPPPLLPVTESQKGLLVVDSWLPHPEIYNQITQFELAPTVSYEQVRSALAEVVAVQPSLRQVFQLQPEMRARLAEPPPPGQLPVERVEVDAATYESATTVLVKRLAQQPFELTAGPAYRFGYVRARDGGAARILMCLHHIVFDGLSIGPLVHDLETALALAASTMDLSTRRAEREGAFHREQVAQTQASASGQVADRVRTWAEQLRQVPPLTLAPRPHRPAQPAFCGARISWALDRRESATLDETCRTLAISPFVFLTGIFGAVVARHSGVDTVLIGSPFSARRTVGAFDLCGFFVNTLPITVPVAWDRTVEQHLTGPVRTAVDFCRSSANVTFNQIVAEVQPERLGRRNPLFSCMLAMQDTYDIRRDGMVTAVREPANGWAKFDLWLGASRIDGGWLLELEYDEAVISAAVADGVLESLRSAVRRAGDDRSRPLTDLFVNDVGAPTVVPQPPGSVADRTLIDWIRAAAERSPDAAAVEEPDRQLTYRALMAAADEIAGGLIRLGVSAGDVVAVATNRLCDTVSVILGILRCGATFVPLDPVLPPDRLATMVRIARCRIAVGEGIDLPGVHTVTPADLARDGTEQTLPGKVPACPAYAMFTSGSTGIPKGVLMGQGPLLNLGAWQIDALRHDENTRFFQYAPLTFDVSYQEILPPLAAGGTVVSRQPADRRDFPALVRRVAETRVTHLFLPAAALRPFAQSTTRIGAALPHLRYVCVSGEQLVVDDHIRRFFADLNDCTLVNLYGPTETNAVTVHLVSGNEAQWPTHVPIGQPMHGVAAYVVDQSGHLAPPGAPGELFLGGDCVADGYLNDPERTAAGFVPDRFSTVAGARMYRTGDLVVRDEDGVLVYLGRRDTQVKVRGHRVELGEIETVANSVAGVQEAVAIAWGTGADVELVLFVRAEDGAQVDHLKVKAHLASTLPAYMTPTWVFDLAQVPTSATGKTDRAALTAQTDSLITEAVAAVPAVTADYLDDTERELAELWAEILGVQAVSPAVSLLELGAHSLNVFVAFAEIQHRYGTTVDVASFFRNPTVAALADLVRVGQ